MKIIFALICGLGAGVVYRTWGWQSATLFAAILVIAWIALFLCSRFFLWRAALMLADLSPNEQKAKLDTVGRDTRIDLEKLLKKIAETHR